jgi:hypothetical protein
MALLKLRHISEDCCCCCGDRLVDNLISAFEARVLADGGTFEAKSCLKEQLLALDLVYDVTFVSAPVISGEPFIGATIQATTGVVEGIAPIIYTYQWLLNGSPISGATNATYTTTNLGELTCIVTGTNIYGAVSQVSNTLNIGLLLLDVYSNAAAAYSLRRLNSDYTGDAIRVRRASDNTEQNIGFVNNELDVNALETFCSGTNGFVTTWYDQSGNARDAKQTTAANQPQIVSSGSVILKNGKPSVQFNGSNNTLISSVGFMNNQADIYSSVVFSTTSTTTNQMVHSNPSGALSNRGYDLRLPNSTQIQLAIRTNPSGTGTNAIGNFNYSSGNYNLVTGTFNALLSTNEQKIYGNASLVAEISNPGDNIENNGVNGGMLIGSFGTINNFGAYLNGNVGELIFYTSDQSFNRTGIETNINNFYSIY